MLLADLESLVPSWMLDAPRAQWSQLMASIAAWFDAAGEAVRQARFAAMPGMLDIPGGNDFDDVSALPLTGRDRNIRGGLNESPFDWAARQRGYLQSWSRAATPVMLLQQLAGVLSPNPPVLRLVNAHGVWWTRQPNGSVSQFKPDGSGFNLDDGNNVGVSAANARAWDWDSLADVPPFGFDDPSRFWVIVYAPADLPYLAGISGLIGDGRIIGQGVGGPDATTIGTTAPSKETELIRDIISTWRGQGLPCSHVIIVFGAATDYFNPDGTSPDYPDGAYGWPCKIISGVMSPTRPTYARYWRAEPYGIAGSNAGLNNL